MSPRTPSKFLPASHAMFVKHARLRLNLVKVGVPVLIKQVTQRSCNNNPATFDFIAVLADSGVAIALVARESECPNGYPVDLTGRQIAEMHALARCGAVVGVLVFASHPAVEMAFWIGADLIGPHTQAIRWDDPDILAIGDNTGAGLDMAILSGLAKKRTARSPSTPGGS